MISLELYNYLIEKYPRLECRPVFLGNVKDDPEFKKIKQSASELQNINISHKKITDTKWYLLFLVRETGLEPVRVAPHAPQTCASADSATLASTVSIIAERYLFVNTFLKFRKVQICIQARQLLLTVTEPVVIQNFCSPTSKRWLQYLHFLRFLRQRRCRQKRWLHLLCN